MKFLLPFLFLTVLLASNLKTRLLRGEDDLFKSHLIDPKWSYEAVCLEDKKSFSAMEKAPGNLVIETRNAINHPKFSLPPSLNFVKVLNSFLGSIFKEDVNAAIASFGNVPISVAGIAKGLADNEWKINGNVDDMSSAIASKYAGNKQDLTEKEAAFFIIETVFEYGAYKCKNCLEKIREEITGFFQFLDCDEKRFVQAINLYTVGKKFTAGDHLKTTDVNDWLLKEDLKGIGRLDLKQFTEAVLKSLYEVNYLVPTVVDTPHPPTTTVQGASPTENTPFDPNVGGGAQPTPDVGTSSAPPRHAFN